MNYIYRLLSVIFISVVLLGCLENEELNLTPYPTDSSIAIIKPKDSANDTIYATYGTSGELKLSSPIERVYTIQLDKPLLQDMEIDLEIQSLNIPSECIDLSESHLVIPAGYTSKEVTLKIKNDDLTFARMIKEEASFELGLKISHVSSNQCVIKEDTPKVILKKEAFKLVCFLNGESNVNIERLYLNDEFVDNNPIEYNCFFSLSEPAQEDVSISLMTNGLDEKYLDDVVISPKEITIPKGETRSQDITWSISTDFLLDKDEPINVNLTLSYTVDSKDPFVCLPEENKTVSLNISKYYNKLEALYEESAEWINWDHSAWGMIDVDKTAEHWYTNNLLDGKGGESGSDIAKNGPFWFVIDMGEIKPVAVIRTDHWAGGNYSPTKVRISTSLDNQKWVSYNDVSLENKSVLYYKFLAPQDARFIKYEILEVNQRTQRVDVTEFYVYGLR